MQASLVFLAVCALVAVTSAEQEHAKVRRWSLFGGSSSRSSAEASSSSSGGYARASSSSSSGGYSSSGGFASAGGSAGGYSGGVYANSRSPGGAYPNRGSPGGEYSSSNGRRPNGGRPSGGYPGEEYPNGNRGRGRPEERVTVQKEVGGGTRVRSETNRIFESDDGRVHGAVHGHVDQTYGGLNDGAQSVGVGGSVVATWR